MSYKYLRRVATTFILTLVLLLGEWASWKRNQLKDHSHYFRNIRRFYTYLYKHDRNQVLLNVAYQAFKGN